MKLDDVKCNICAAVPESDIYSYHVYLFSDMDELCDLWLPKTPEGFLRFSDDAKYSFLSLYAKDEQWVIACRQPAFFLDVPMEHSYEMPLSDGLFLNVDTDEITYRILVEKVLPNRMILKNYDFQTDRDVVVGCGPECDIYYNGPFVSKKHAVLSRRGGKWSIRCCDTVYGMYINKQKRSEAELKLGDVIFLMGLKIIVGSTFLAVNSGLGRVEVKGGALSPIPFAYGSRTMSYYEEKVEESSFYFDRAPRKRRETEQKVITIEGPPMSMSQNKMPLLLRMGSSMVMGGAAALAGNFMTLITSVMFPFLSSKYTDAQRQEYEKQRKAMYTAYLDKKRQEIVEAIDIEHDALNAKYPPLDEVVRLGKTEHLWERRPNDSDFLQLRLGTGERPLSAAIEYPARHFALETDELEDAMYQLAEADYVVQDVPIVLPLTESFICGFQGQRDKVFSALRSLITQIAVHHSYDEVKMVFLLSPGDLTQMSSLRYLPHVWDDLRTIRFVATNGAEAYTIGEHIKNQLADGFGKKSELNKAINKRPYYIIFALDKKLFDGHEVFKEILQQENNPGASVLAAYEGLPKECQKIITLLDNENNTCMTLGVDGGEDEKFRSEEIVLKQFSETMHLLANTSLKKVEKGQEMPKMVTFLEMFRVGRIEQLNPLKRWRENDPTKSLAAPVGVGEDGSVFMLDLHEKRQGPHGLVAGMTGSGKSEFIITYILSMAVNYHPDEVAFVLIDYKGGGLADAFENPRTGIRLPHLAGTITNLDGASIQRSLMSIESELVRRQKLFSEVSKNLDESSMNIYTYQKLYRAGKVSEPMPHLFIISDEFAELKQQQPEFMDKLISAARIGRSLGVHLILATQKPSGVVNDQIRSNTKFRVCLRVQDRGDSMDMLKRPEAAELTDTGRFYLQVGYNEFFAQGQSAWCGAPYEPQDTVVVQKDDSLEFLDNTGQLMAKAKPKVKKSDSEMKQIGAVVHHLAAIAEKQNIESHNLWVEALPKQLDTEEISNISEFDNPEKVCAVLGMVDDPENQTQFPFVAPLQEYQNLLVVGNGGSGKTTLLKTLLFSLTERYSPERVNFYILDFSGGTMNVFKKAPHCGAFLSEQDESAIDRFWKMLREIANERKKLFNELGVTSFEACTAVCNIPLIFIVIDNASGLASLTNGNVYFSSLHEYIKVASGFGIKFIISCNSMNEVSTRTRQEIGNKIALQLKDRFAYSDVLDVRSATVPLAVNGRGMCVVAGRGLEFHTAMPFAMCSEIERVKLMSQRLSEIAQRDCDITPAKRLPIIEPEETYEAFCQGIPVGRIPLGYDTQNIKRVSIPFAQLYRAGVYLGQEKATAPLLDNLAYAAKKNNMDLVFVKSSKSVLDSKAQTLASYPGIRLFSNTKNDSLQLCYLLIDEVKKRKVFRNEYCNNHNIPLTQAKDSGIVKQASSYIREKTKPLMVIFEDLCEFGGNLEDGCFSVYSDIFSNGKGYNFYLFGCLYPNNSEAASRDLLTAAFVDKALFLLFGGQTQKQTLIAIPPEFTRGPAAKMQYNEFLLNYNGAFYPMVMPCRAPAEEEIDPDEMPII